MRVSMALGRPSLIRPPWPAAATRDENRGILLSDPHDRGPPRGMRIEWPPVARLQALGHYVTLEPSPPDGDSPFRLGSGGRIDDSFTAPVQELAPNIRHAEASANAAGWESARRSGQGDLKR